MAEGLETLMVGSWQKYAEDRGSEVSLMMDSNSSDMMMGPVMSEMQMSMDGTYNVGTVLINGNKVSTPAQFITLCLLIILFAFLTQLFHVVQGSLKQQVKEKHLKASLRYTLEIENGNTNSSGGAIAKNQAFDGNQP